MGSDEEIKLSLNMGDSAKEVEGVRKKVQDLGDELEKVPPAAAKTTKSFGDMGNAALQGSRALQDFTQGGIAGILNNIEGVVSALGGSSGLAGVLTAVGVAAYIALPKVKEWFHAVVDGANEIPEAADALKRLTTELEANAKKLKELHEHQSITNTQLKEYNQLTERQVELEKQVNAEKERRKQAEEVKGLKPFGQKEAEGERGEAMKTLLGDEKDRKKLVDEATKHVESIYDTQDMKRIGPVNKEILGELGGSFKPGMSHEENVRTAIERAMNRAITGGNEADIRKLIGFLPPGSKTRSHIEESTLPENLKRQQAEIDAEAEHFGKVSEANKARHAHERRMEREGKVHGRVIDQMGDKAEADRTKAEAKEARDLQAQIRASRRAVVQGGALGGIGGGAGGGGGHGGGAEIPLDHAPLLPANPTEWDLANAALANRNQQQANEMALDAMGGAPRQRPIYGPRRRPRLRDGSRLPLGAQHLPGSPYSAPADHAAAAHESRHVHHEAVQQAMLNNQQQMTANLQAQQQQLQQAKKIGSANQRIARQRQQPMANYGW